MVIGRKMIGLEAKHLVVDLDGTLSKVNTFRRWTVGVFLFGRPVLDADALHALYSFVGIYVNRLARLLDHDGLRSAFITAWALRLRSPVGQSLQTLNETFADTIVSRYLDPQVLNLVHRFRNTSPSGRIVLATAAPAFYANRVGSILGLEVIATPVTDSLLREEPYGDWLPNSRGRKLVAVRQWLNAESFALVTDSCDDWPLIEAATSVYLVRAHRGLVERAKRLEKAIHLLDGSREID